MTDQGRVAHAKATEETRDLRVSCPVCGRILFRILRVSDGSEFALETKCKAGGCHRMLEVAYAAGKISVASL